MTTGRNAGEEDSKNMPNEKHPKLKARPDEIHRNLVIAFLVLALTVVWCGGAIDVTPYLHATQGTKQMAIAKVLEWDHNILTKAALNPYLRHPALFLLGATLLAFSPVLYGILRKVWRNMYGPGYWLLSYLLLVVLAFSLPGLVMPSGLSQFVMVWWRVTILIGSSAILFLVGLLYVGAVRLRPSDIFRNPNAYDLMDLSGAATLRELKRTSLLVRSGQWPSPDSKAMAGRICIGRLYDDGRPTSFFVAPHISKLQQTLVVAPTGSGKTTSLALPWSRELPFKGQSVFVLDFKGDMAPHIRPAFEGVGAPELWVFDPLSEKSIRWNPMREPQPGSTEFAESQDSIAEAIFGEVNGGAYQFFDLMDLRILKAGVRAVINLDAPSLKALHDLFLNEEHLEENLDRLKDKVAREAYELMDADLKATTDSQRFSFTERIQGVRNKLDAFAHTSVQCVTAPEADFRLEKLMEKPSCLVFAAPMRMGLAGEMLAAMAVRLLQYQLHKRYGHTGGRLFLVLDEFSKLALDHRQTERFISVSRSAGTVSVIILQDLEQLHPGTRASIWSNCQDRYILRGASAHTSKWLSESLGERCVWKRGIMASATHGSNRQSESGGLSAHEEYVPVLRPREITLTGGLERGAWLQLSRYSHKPILVDLTRPL